MPLVAAGEKLGPYEIQEQLGAGGMGEVWKALDTRLHRFVAIKKSHAHFSERLSREAHAIAALNHPHICQLYDVGPDYLVMEYVEGKPLTGPLPIVRVLEYAGQICDALDTAHRKGITHRDLKPANILAGKTGVKILDFGLAKIEREPQANANATQTMPLTGDGVVVGTLQYMSPEQIEGQEADARSDIFALGLVMYEMISGAHPFTGKSKTSLIASILKEQPKPLRETEPLTPPSLERVVQTCLEKDPDKRWQSARELKHAIEWIQDGVSPVAPALSDKVRKSGPSWTSSAVALAVAMLAAAALALWLRPSSPARVVRFEVALPEGAEYIGLSVSPDGRKLVVVDNSEQHRGLWIRDLDALGWKKLPGTEGARFSFWSPDSRSIAFSTGNELKKIDALGGPAQTICVTKDSTIGSGDWNRDGVIIFGGLGADVVRKVPATGGTPAPVTVQDTARGELSQVAPVFLPDRRHFLYTRSGPDEITGVYAGSLDAKPEAQSATRILATSRGLYSDGNLFFAHNGALMVQPFDAGKLQLRGEPALAAESAALSDFGTFSVSPAGVLAYRTAPEGTRVYQGAWFDRQGNMTGTVNELVGDPSARLSPEGERAGVRDAGQTALGDVWILDFATGIRTRLAFRHSFGSIPVWSPDGSRVTFSGGNVFDTLYEKAVGGAEEKELLKQPGQMKIPSAWSSDARFLLYHTPVLGKGGADLYVLPMEGPDRTPGKPVRLLGTKYNEAYGSFSPDGRWIAYASDESGRWEVYVRPFLAAGPSGPSLGEAKWQVSKEGFGGAAGTGQLAPKWRRDGQEIVFRGLNGLPVAVDVSAKGGAFNAGMPKQLFDAPANLSWDVTADGKRFLMVSASQISRVPITVVLNWQTDLKK
jgi:eukaryotic-like serine/threonine-protein kinase